MLSGSYARREQTRYAIDRLLILDARLSRQQDLLLAIRSHMSSLPAPPDIAKKLPNAFDGSALLALGT